MIQYRPFLNTDTPGIVDIWRHQNPFRGFFSGCTRDILDQHVFSKPYFDRLGLTIAVNVPDDPTLSPEPLGFVHASFAPNETLSDLDYRVGVVSQLKLKPGHQAIEIGHALLNHAIEYLKQHSATVAHVGGDFPQTPFYLGLYGGSRVPGVMEEDRLARQVFQEAGFETTDSICVLERKLAGFRTLIDRQQLALRRQFQIKAVPDPLESSWWESCTMGMAERDRFNVFDKLKRENVGTVSFWDMQPLAGLAGGVGRGLYDLKINEDLRRSGMATFLVGESMRHLMQQGVARIEAQAPESDIPSLGVFKKLAFQTLTRGYLMSKPI